MVTTVPMDLLEAAKAGDDWAFEALLEPLVDSAYRVAWAMLHDRAAAEDAVQEASLLAWRKKPPPPRRDARVVFHHRRQSMPPGPTAEVVVGAQVSRAARRRFGRAGE